jgi:hypothetical protein
MLPYIKIRTNIPLLFIPNRNGDVMVSVLGENKDGLRPAIFVTPLKIVLISQFISLGCSDLE